MATRAGPMRLLMALLMISTAHATATPSLHELARSGDAAGLTAALQAAPTGVNDNDSYGWTPLFWAVDGGHVDAVRVLMTYGADSAKGRDGWTALMWACGGVGNPAVVSVFLSEFGAPPDVAAANGKTALMVAAAVGNSAAVEALLAAGATVATRDREGTQALTLAAKDGYAPVVRLLLSAGASPTEATVKGRPLVHVVAAQGHAEVMHLLLDAGAAADEPSGDDQATPLMAAAERGHVMMVQTLLSRGASVAAVDSDGCTALARAARWGKASVLSALAAAGATVEVRDANHWTPLMHAAAGGHDAACAALLAAGADVDAVTPAGQPPLELALIVAPRSSAPPVALRKAVQAQADDMTREGSSASVSNWACLHGHCQWAATLRAAGVTMALLFDNAKNAHNDEKFHEGMLADSYALLKWALVRPGAQPLANLLLTHPSTESSVAVVDVNAAYARAAVERMQVVMAALAAHPRLDVHAFFADAGNRTALELAFDKDTERSVLQRVRARLETTDVKQWTAADVVNWMAAAGHSVFREALRTSAVDGEMLLTLAPDAVAAKDIKVLSSGKKLLHWAVRHGLPEVLAAVVKRAEFASAAVATMEPEGLTPLEAALADSRLHPRLDALAAVVQNWQRSMPAEQWTADHVVNWLHVIQCGQLAPLARLDNVKGRQLKALLPLLSMPQRLKGSRGGVHSGSAAMELTAAHLREGGAMTRWAFSRRLRHLAGALAAAAQDVSTDDGFSAWVALHGDLPDESLTPLEVATVEGWAEEAAAMTPLVKARLASIPVVQWTPADVANMAVGCGRPALAAAFRQQGDVSGAALVHGNLTDSFVSFAALLESCPESGHGDGALLLWALEKKLPVVAQHLLSLLPPHVPALPASAHGTALEVALSHNVSSAVPSLRSAASARLAALGWSDAALHSNWTAGDVANWLLLHDRRSLVPAFRADDVNGTMLVALRSAAAVTTADGQEAAESEPTEAALLAALEDLRTRLLWTVRAAASGDSSLSAVMHAFLHSMDATQVGPTLLQSHPAVPGDGTLLAWIHTATHGTAKSALMDHLYPHLHEYLAAQPVAEWTAPQVRAWLMVGGATPFIRLFKASAVDGSTLEGLLARHGHTQALAGTVRADALTADLPTLMHWALDDMLPSLAVSLLQRTPSLAHAGLPDARDTVLGVAMARGVAVAEVTDMLQDMVMNRLEGVLREPLPHHQWSAEDVANWQYVNSLWRYPRALYEAGVDGPTLLTLCDPINATALKDSDAVLSWAVDRGLRPVVARALELGADPNRADEFGATLLMEAAWQGSAELSETLLAAGAAVDLQNSNGYTALMRAALRGNAKVVNVLLKYNANVHLTNSRGKTAAMLAKSKEHNAMADLLRQRQHLM